MRILLLLMVIAFATASDPAFTLVVDTTKAGSAANQFVLPLNPSYSTSYNCAVDWGDGTGAQTVTNGTTGFPNISHTYVSSGVHSVKITENVVGGFPAIYFTNGGDRLKLTQIANWGGVTWATMNSAFSGCSNLTITATDEATATTGNLTDYPFAWFGCSGLTSFPVLNTAAGTNFYHAWQNCSGLTSFPVLNTAAGTNFSAAWAGCSGLTSFPLLTTAAGTNFSYAWAYCSGLTSFPVLNTAAGTNFYAAWYSCYGLTSFPVLNLGNMTNGAQCFSGPTFTPASYSALLTNLAATNTNTSVTFDGGSSRYYASAATARNTTLVTGKSWTITDGGQIAAPTITNVSPSAGPLSSGPEVTITGTGFTGATGVTFGVNAATSVTAVSDTTITCLPPTGVVGPVAVTVNAPSGSVTRLTAYTYQSPFTLVVDTTKAGSAANQFVLPLNPSYSTSYNCAVDWGDGTGAQTVTNGTTGFPNISHTYASSGVYSVKITENVVGGFPAIYFNAGGDRLKLMQIANWGGVTWATMNSAFYGCSNLRITATDEATAKTGSVANFSYAWYSCIGLTSFPVLNTAAGTNFSYAWSVCGGLTSFPVLNTAAGTDFSFAWTLCGGLTSFPVLNTAAGTNFSNAWDGCMSLTSFPVLNTTAGRNFHSAWYGCSGLTSFPLLNTAAGTSFSQAWQGCSGLTSFPLLNTAAGTSFSQAWSGCSGLTSFPALNTATGTNFYHAWQGCSGLTGFPVLNLGKMIYGGGCFLGDTLTPASYSALLTNLASTNSNTGVTFDGGNSRYYASAANARNTTLVTGKSWTITDGGQVAAPTITNVSPSNGPYTSGPLVTITGTGFTGATGVTFGANTATSVTAVSDTTITCLPPAGPSAGGPVTVTVTAPSGTVGLSGAYTYQPQPFILVVDTTKFGSAANQFQLPLNGAYSTTYNCAVDWGDGAGALTVTNGTTGFPNITHTYASSGVYSVKITENVVGGFPAIYFYNSKDHLKLMQIANWGGVTWATMNSAFYGCSNLRITATDEATAKTGSVTNFNNAWDGCYGLTSFPVLNTAAGTTFIGAWSNCSGLTSFPVLNTAAGTYFLSAWEGCSGLTSFPMLNTAAGTSFVHAWFGCSGLTSFPVLSTAAGTDFVGAWAGCIGLTSFPALNTAAGTTFSEAWSGCSGLTSFPALNTAAGTSFSNAWQNCSGLTSFPVLNTAAGTDFISAWLGCRGLTSFPALNTSAGTDFNAAWGSCSGLTSFPLLNTALGTDFGGTWYGCSGLTSFPALNTAAGTNFSNAWNSCSGLTSFPVLNLGKMTNGSGCFSGDTLTPASYSALLTNLAATNTNTGIPFGGGNSPYYASASSARNTTLIAGRNWVITDGGQVAAPTITNVSPSNGPLTSGPLVTITGTGFTGATSVTFGGNSATSVTAVSDTSITCLPPTGTIGSVTVTVYAPSGTVVLAGAYTYKLSQTITGFNAFGAHTYGDPAFTITGVTGGASGQSVVFTSGNPAVATVSGTTVTITGSGTAVITATQAGNTNYSAALAVPETLTVTKAPLTVTAADTSRAFGAGNPSFTGTLTGVVNSDPITATYASSATATTAVGVYGPSAAEAITPTLVDPTARLGNYTVTSTKGTLTITSVAGVAQPQQTSQGAKCGMGSGFGAMAGLLVLMLCLALGAMKPAVRHAS